MPLQTPLCDLLGIDVPILSVGFGWSATADLVAAVSNAGGLGVLGLGVPREEAGRQVARTRALTTRPFGGNIIIAAFASAHATDEQRASRHRSIETALELRVPALVLFWGDPSPFVGPAHAAGVKLLIQVGSVDEAANAVRAGVDAVIVQGVEAGGHVKATRSLWELLPAAVAACGSTPVIASGGIGDGRGIARALKAGAQGVSLGTRFVASEEAWVHARYKERLVTANAADAVLTPDLYDVGWRDAPHRALKNKTYADWVAAGSPSSGARPHESEELGTFHLPWADVAYQRYAAAMLVPAYDGDPEYPPMWAGESVDHVREVRPAGEIVRQLVRETEDALR